MADPITVYATEDDLRSYGLPRDFLDHIDDPDLIPRALAGASETAAGFLSSQYSMPLTAISEDLRQMVSWMAAYTIMSSTGYAPDAGQDNQFEKRDALARKWLHDVRHGMKPPGIQGNATAGPGSGQAAGARPFGVSGSQRGYSSRGTETNIVHDLARTRGGFVGD